MTYNNLRHLEISCCWFSASETGPGPYDIADVKIPINWGKGNEDLKVAAERLGEKIVRQRLRMKGLGKTPLHIVDLRKLSLNARVSCKENVINAIGHQKHLVFIN